MRRLVSTAAFLIVLVASGCSLTGDDSGKGGRKVSERELAQLVLQQADLGRGFQAFSEGRTIRAELSPALGGDPYRFGRQNGWTVRLRGPGDTRARGISTLVSTVDVFADSTGAGKFYDADRKVDVQTTLSSGLEDVETERIGDESRAVSSKGARPGSVVYVEVTWRDGRFVCSVSANGFAGHFRLGDVVALAQRQERRLTAKHEV